MDNKEEQKEEQGFKNLEDVTQIHKIWEEERVKWLTVSRTPHSSIRLAGTSYRQTIQLEQFLHPMICLTFVQTKNTTDPDCRDGIRKTSLPTD